MQHPKILCALLFSILLLPLFLLGCSGNQGTPASQNIAGNQGTQTSQNTAQQATMNQQLKDIDDNTHMPPQAKEAAKAAILRGQQVNMGGAHK